MKPAITNATCRLRCAGHCAQCQADPAWRQSVGTPSPCGDTRGPYTGGLGDQIARVTSAVGIKPCGGCKGRQRLGNRISAAVGALFH